MSPRTSKQLSAKIFTTVLAFALVVVIALSLLLTCTYYFAYEEDYAEDLKKQTTAVASYLDSVPAITSEALDQCVKLSQGMRLTLIAPDGTVVYDSTEIAQNMENHANRPEIAQALNGGSSSSMRYSQTVYTDTLYSAMRLQNGEVVRLSENRASIWAFFRNLAVPFLIVIIVTVLFVLVLSRLLARRIMKPIEALDLADPLDNDIYREMEPLLVRIDEQQRQLKEQNVRLAQAESLRRDFSANVSHEMKTPLQVISGYSELMMSNMVPADDVPKVSAVIHDESLAMRKLVDDVLTLSKLDELPTSTALSGEVDLLVASQFAVNRLKSVARSHGVTIEVTGEHACIQANETLVEEILHNLIENGIRYNHEGGVVCVHTSVEEDASGKGQGRARIVVEDTGIGIPSEMRDKIFERFYRVDKSRSRETGGTGLGLAIVKHGVASLGGSISLESEMGKGSCFTLEFPAASPKN